MNLTVYGIRESRNSSFLSRKLSPLLLVCLAVPQLVLAAEWTPRETAVFDLVNLQRSINSLPPLVQNDLLHTTALEHSQSMADNGFFSHTTLVGDNGTQFWDRFRDVGYLDWTYGGENIAGGHGRTYPPPEQLEPTDAARNVMYGTADLDELNAFFFSSSTNNWTSWDEVGVDITGDQWDSWHTFKQEQSNNQLDGGWMGSHGHRDNILSILFDDIGVGYVWEPDDTAPIQWDEGEIGFPLHTYWTQDFTGDDIVAPVPLPGAFWLLASGLAGLIVAGRSGGTARKPV
jgi:uncharacterized protein YkwD